MVFGEGVVKSPGETPPETGVGSSAKNREIKTHPPNGSFGVTDPQNGSFGETQASKTYPNLLPIGNGFGFLVYI